MYYMYRQSLLVRKRSVVRVKTWQTPMVGFWQRISSFACILLQFSRRTISTLTVCLAPFLVVKLTLIRGCIDLPPGVRLADVYVDFLTYVLRHIREHLKSDVGTDYWTSDTEIVIPHPNKWGNLQQDFLMQVVVASGFVEDSTYGRSRVYFVEESEASARYCISSSGTPFASQLKVCMFTLAYPAKLLWYAHAISLLI